ncbi:MAG: hypothetical protein H7Y17_17520 [Chlorobia bacterium]|nr:hypothetical protein [Fimbriimonadaceae bacterium]
MSVKEALRQLHEVSPDAPFLALGQTIFWDEPMKAGIALASKRQGYSRRFVAGVHDTDYFAKLPSGKKQTGKFKAFTHNDTTTKGLWSAAGEFSTLFGSETVVSKESLVHAGLKIEKLRKARPDLLDEATEAWGWRGIVSLDDSPPVSAELPLKPVFQELRSTFDWALENALASLTGDSKAQAEELADELRTKLCDALEADPNPTLSSFYKRLLPEFYNFAAGIEVDLDVATTTELLRFNRLTVHLPRFQLLDAFLNPQTKSLAAEGYDQSIHGSGLYDLKRFGTGAIPFDLVVPGKGRGTIRLGNRGLVVMTRQPLFASLKKPVESVAELAEIIERKFGADCTLVGKAVTLIGMLAREFVFVFHEGASSYVKHSRKLHQELAASGLSLPMNPILRVRYQAWDGLQVACSWLHLPEPFQRPFGTEELCAPSFAARWKAVGEEQTKLLGKLGDLKRQIDLIRFLEGEVGGSWSCLAREYEGLHSELEKLKKDVDELAAKRHALYAKIKALKAKRVELEIAKGDHFRTHIFEKSADSAESDRRVGFEKQIESVISEIEVARRQVKDLMRQQRELAQAPDVLKVHDRRRSIEMEAELKRLRLIRDAVISSKGLQNANLRPSAWWFPLVCPDGLWFRETVDAAQCYLEPLV